MRWKADSYASRTTLGKREGDVEATRRGRLRLHGKEKGDRGRGRAYQSLNNLH